MTTKNKKSTEQKLQEILVKGTPRQKALLVCKERREPLSMRLYGEEPLLTEGDAIAIRDSFDSKKEALAYNKWMAIYGVYLELLPLFGLGLAEYHKEANRLVGLLNIWEAYEQEADLINTLYLSVKETGNEEAVEAFVNAATSAGKSITFGNLIRRKDGFFSVERGAFLQGLIETAQRNVKDALQALKALIVVIEDFTKETRSKDFIPELLATSIKDAKKDYRAFNISTRYSCAELRKRKERGEKVTKQDEERAVFPEYDLLEVLPEHIKHFESELINTEEREGLI